MRTPEKKDTPPIDRKEKVLFSCNTDGVGLEIGPSYNPVAPKREGYNIEILDHASADNLRKKFGSDPNFDTINFDIKKIEEVDYVWTGQPLHELTGKVDYYDYIIASHVIEHTPNMVTFLQQCEIMLKPQGVLALAIPDRRYCFDFLRPNSTTGQVLQAWYEKRVFHTPATIFDFYSNYVYRSGLACWTKDDAGKLEFANSFDQAVNMFKLSENQDEYVDAHNWCFTPSSFRLIMSDLLGLALIELNECTSFNTPDCEFLISYRKGGSAVSVDRMALSLAAVNGE